MAALRILMMLVGALAVLALGAIGAEASADAAPPCHEMSTQLDGGTSTPAPAPDDPMTPMGCCVACVAAPAIRPASAATPSAPPACAAWPCVALLAGRTTSPDPDPPRLTS